MRITTETVRSMRSWTPDAFASCLDGRARALAKESKEWFVEVGLICAEVERGELWRHILDDQGEPYASFGHWMLSVWGESKSTAYEALKVIRTTRDLVPEESLRETPRCNLRQMGDLSTAVLADPEIQEAARTKSRKEFTRTVRDKYPEQHLAELESCNLTLTRDQWADINKWMEWFRIIEDSPLASREDSIYHTLRSFWQDWDEERVKAWVFEQKEALGAIQ